jgi:hypothetical protein
MQESAFASEGQGKQAAWDYSAGHGLRHPVGICRQFFGQAIDLA